MFFSNDHCLSWLSSQTTCIHPLNFIVHSKAWWKLFKWMPVRRSQPTISLTLPPRRAVLVCTNENAFAFGWHFFSCLWYSHLKEVPAMNFCKKSKINFVVWLIDGSSPTIRTSYCLFPSVSASVIKTLFVTPDSDIPNVSQILLLKILRDLQINTTFSIKLDIEPT